ncbi:lambda exonuclease family protein [Xenorhabdus bovienii]|uniref:lambda exonuclease family protein n=1 Tax=Xenorhabdus bovienii TaxID=40576 RepID=UPI0023B25B45|nr:lambda exonuclease family protein [Xenorhabdus bovienii]MDE9463583.1 YqaJ viral recombinase family protein [Xenorhabdus bovienii]MDE9566703.1 YqaJ viral recombinase family protein [Xenorhabdus bovienii]
MNRDIILDKTGIDIDVIEQGSDAWMQLRLGVITASDAWKILTKDKSKNVWSDTKSTYLYELIGEVCTGVYKEINARTLAWGKEYEQEARDSFSFYSDLDVTEVPILYRDESMRTACSPDGLCNDRLGLELKCPSNTDVFIKMALNGVNGIKREYIAQMQFSMWVTGLSAWNFVNYDPRMPAGKEIVHVLVERDAEYMKQFDELIPEFIERMDANLKTLGIKFGNQWRNI